MSQSSTTERRRFVEQSSWNAFGVGLAGVVAVLLLVFMFTTPVCTLGLPWLPMLMTGSVTLHEKSDLRVSISREGFAVIGTTMVRNRDIERALGDVPFASHTSASSSRPIAASVTVRSSPFSALRKAADCRSSSSAERCRC